MPSQLSCQQVQLFVALDDFPNQIAERVIRRCDLENVLDRQVVL